MACAQASERTHSFSSFICPLCSAIGMSTSGGTAVPSNRFQRKRASKPKRRPVARSTAGWNTSDGVPPRPRSGTGIREFETGTETGVETGAETGTLVFAERGLFDMLCRVGDFSRFTRWTSTDAAVP